MSVKYRIQPWPSLRWILCRPSGLHRTEARRTVHLRCTRASSRGRTLSNLIALELATTGAEVDRGPRSRSRVGCASASPTRHFDTHRDVSEPGAFRFLEERSMPKDREKTQPNAAEKQRDEKNDTERQRDDSAHSAKQGSPRRQSTAAENRQAALAPHSRLRPRRLDRRRDDAVRQFASIPRKASATHASLPAPANRAGRTFGS